MNIPRLPPLFLVLALALAMLAIDRIFPQFRVLLLLSVYPGVVLIVAGVLLVMLSAGMFRLRKTTINPFGEPAAMVQDGFYRFSRNPMYLGMLLVLFGVGLWLGNVLALLLAPVFVAIMNRQYIVREEQLLDSRFGDAYQTYRRRVRRWI